MADEDHDLYGWIFISPSARFSALDETAHVNVGDSLSKALNAISENNPVLAVMLEQVDFTRQIGKKIDC